MTIQLRAKTDKQFDDEQATRRAFMAALRAAGWKALGHGCYTHGSGGKVYIDEFRPEWGCPAWKWYSENDQMPETAKEAR